MSFYTIYDNNGYIVATTMTDMGDDYQLTPQYAGMNLIVGQGNSLTQYVLNGVITDYTSEQLTAFQSIPAGCSWSLPSCTVVDNVSLSTVQQLACSAVNIQRDSILSAFDRFTYNGVVYDGGPQAQTNIQMTINVITAGIPLPSNFEWRAQDNIMHPMVANDIIGLNAAMLSALATLTFSTFGISWQLKSQILAIQPGPTARAQVAAIGWPI